MGRLSVQIGPGPEETPVQFRAVPFFTTFFNRKNGQSSLMEKHHVVTMKTQARFLALTTLFTNFKQISDTMAELVYAHDC